MISENITEEEDTDIKRTQFQTLLIASGLLCFIAGVILLLSTSLVDTNSFEFFFTTLISGILFGLAMFLEGHGYFLLPTEYQGHPAYLGDPTLYQIVRLSFYIPYILLCYNGYIFVGDVISLLSLSFSISLLSLVELVFDRNDYENDYEALIQLESNLNYFYMSIFLSSTSILCKTEERLEAYSTIDFLPSGLKYKTVVGLRSINFFFTSTNPLFSSFLM